MAIERGAGVQVGVPAPWQPWSSSFQTVDINCAFRKLAPHGIIISLILWCRFRLVEICTDNVSRSFSTLSIHYVIMTLVCYNHRHCFSFAFFWFDGSNVGAGRGQELLLFNCSKVSWLPILVLICCNAAFCYSWGMIWCWPIPIVNVNCGMSYVYIYNGLL